MTRRLPIRSLIKSPAPSEVGVSESTAHLPPPLLKSLQRWNGLATRIGELIEPLLARPTSVSIELALMTLEDLQANNPKPGLFLATSEGPEAAIYRFPGKSGPTLSACLLRDDQAAGDQAPETFDVLALAEIIDIVRDLVAEAFEIPLPAVTEPNPQLRWPITAPAPGQRLFADFAMHPEGRRPCNLQILFPLGADAVFGALDSAQADRLDTEQMRLRIDGVISRWTGYAADLSMLDIGTRICLPGADLQAVRLELVGKRNSCAFGKAQLQTQRARHVLTVSEIDC